ncbi:MAG: efflux RND transporter periplasmic adaptor subunit [Acidobacteriota bacterium]
MKRHVGMAGLGLVLWMAAGCGEEKKPPAQTDSPSTVVTPVETVREETLPVTYEATGTVKSRLGATLASKVMGQVTAIHVREGDSVQAGQLLLEIDSREATSRVSQAKAGLKEARNALEQITLAIDAADSARTAAEANAELASSTYRRFHELVERGSVSAQEFDQASARYKAARAEARRADKTLQSLRAEKKQTQARIEQAKASLTIAETALSYTRVRSPFSGRVTRRHVEIGDLAAPGVPLLTVESRRYRLEAAVDESQLPHIRSGQVVSVKMDALSQNVEGVLDAIVPSTDPVSRSFTVKVNLPELPFLTSGMFGRAAFSTQPRKALTVPVSSLVEQGQLTGVWVLDGKDRVRFRLLKSGAAYDGRREILSGLKEGERVIVKPAGDLRDGTRIRTTGPAGIE